MEQVHKTVFISYRRTSNRERALLVYYALVAKGFDCFIDVNSLEAGDFPSQIETHIKARAHFLIILSPSTLKRCMEPNDWVRREIELAMDNRRNIIPILYKNFSFANAQENGYLAGEKLPQLMYKQGIKIDINSVEQDINKLTSRRYLGKPIELKIDKQYEISANLTDSQHLDIGELPQPNKNHFSAENLYERAFWLQLNGKLDHAILYYTQALQLNSAFAEALNDRGITYAKKREFPKALEDMSNAIEINPSLEVAYMNRGNVYRSIGNLESALEDYNNAIRLNRQNSLAFYNRAYLFVQMGNLTQAIDDYNTAIDINPDYPEAFNNRGNAHLKQGNSRKAVEDYDSALKLNSNHFVAHTNRGNAYMALGELDLAMIDFNSAVQINPNFSVGFCNRGILQFDLGNYLQARNDFQEALRLQSDLSDALAGLAITQHALGETAEAQALWRQLIDRDEHYKDADWVGNEFQWLNPLIDAARRLIATL